MKLKFTEKDGIAGVMLTSIIAQAWGTLVFPITIGLSTFDFKWYDGLFLIVLGFLGMLSSNKWYEIYKEKKWYESIRRT